jgi:5-methylthioadenosine/S-adenosylhomocysteine deaminase
VQLDQDGIGRMARSGAALAHCPVANLYGGSGVAPVPALRRTGVRVGLGTDGAASNNSQNLFETMKFASLVQRGVGQMDVGVEEAFRMATIDGAAALGLADQLGRIEPGYRADLVLLDPNRLPMAPHHQPLSDIVYAAGPGAVEAVFVDGVQVVDDGRLTQLDTPGLLREAQARAEALVRRASLDHLRHLGAADKQ